MQIELAEYNPTPGVALSPLQRDQLRRLAPSITVEPTIGASDRYDLTPGSFVGVCRLSGDLEVVIRPKLPIERVLFLVSYAVGLGRWAAEAARLAEADSLVEAIIPAFSYQVRRAIERGLVQGYRTEEEALVTVRGRWRIGDQIGRRFGVAPPVEVTYDDFTEDIELNRLLRAAVHRLLRLRIRHERLRWPLRSLDSRLDGVALVEYDRRRIPEAQLDRRTEHYRGAVGLARLILAGTSFDLRAGTTPASAFLIDMNRVFEDFVITALRDAIGHSHGTLVQGAAGRRLFLDIGKQVPLKPDISLWQGGDCRFVGDVKYKRLRTGESPNADLYQLSTYAVATDLPGGILVYAAGADAAATHVVAHLGKRLELLPLDLGASPDQLLAEITGLARRIVREAA